MAETDKPATTKSPRSKRVPAGSSIDFPSVPGRRNSPASSPEPNALPDTQTTGLTEDQENGSTETQHSGGPEILEAEFTDMRKVSTTASKIAGANGEPKGAEIIDPGAGTPPEPEPIYTIKRTYNMTTDELTAVATMQTAALRRSGKKPDTSTIVRLAVQHFSQQPDHLEILLAHRRDMAKAKEQKAEADSAANQNDG